MPKLLARRPARPLRAATPSALLVAVAIAVAVAAVAPAPAAAESPGEPSLDAGGAPGLGLPGDVAAAAAAPSPNVVSLGDAPVLTEVDGLRPNQRVVGIAARPGGGAWLTARDGGVFALGGAGYHGSTGDIVLTKPVVGIGATPSGEGYWLVASDGGVFAFGDAGFHGSTGDMVLNRPVVGMATTPSGEGYWLVASDGGVFAFGDAVFHGSTGGMVLNRPVVGIAATPTGLGYWLIASDGGVFAFGDAAFFGARPRDPLAAPVTGIATTATGYLVVGADGDLDAFGAFPDVADLDPAALGTGSVVGVAPSPSGQGAWLAVGRVGDNVSVSQPRGLSDAIAGATVAAARAAGGEAAVVHSGTLGVTAVRRADTVVQAPRSGWRYPAAAVALDPAAATRLDGPVVGEALAAGQVVMGATGAQLRTAQAGDELDVVGWDGVTRRLRIAAVVPDDVVGWSEIVMSTTTAAGMGFVRPAWVELWDFRSRAAVDAALADRLPPTVRLDVDRSWEPPDPDAVLPSSTLKAVFGEFSYLPLGGGPIQQDPDWRAANITTGTVPILGTVTCHRLLFAPLRGALGEVQAAGLAGLVDVADTRNGGCYSPREIVSGGGTTGGSLSRHSWALAYDINPSQNPFGGTPRMDRRIVDIFRRWGFAWGGTWTLPDGMHFELVRAG